MRVVGMRCFIFWLKQEKPLRDFDFFDQICPKRVLPVENKKRKHQHGILDSQIIFGTKF